MIATLAWLGSLAFVVMWIYPTERKNVQADQIAPLTIECSRIALRISWFSLFVLAISGLFQMSSSVYYDGLLAIENIWSIVIFIKHVLILVMAILTAIGGSFLLPKITRLQLMIKSGRGVAPFSVKKNQTQLIQVLLVNLILGLVVLALTAIARVQ